MPHYYYKSEILDDDALRLLHKEWAGSEISYQNWLDLRDRCRKDLFFLGTKILGWNWIERVHRPVCDFFVQKNFDGCYPEGYTLEDVHKAINKQDVMKERMLLDPRGSFKSTINGVDCVQWIINCPEIRIFIVTAEYDNAVLFLHEIKNYFYLPEEGSPTKFHRIFPEYIITGVDGTSESPLECPARKLQKKFPTLWVNAISATLASRHTCIFKADDCVSDRNSNSEETRRKLKAKFDNCLNLLDEWGYLDWVGTRYAGGPVSDYYGERLKLPQDEAPLKLFKRAAWTVKEEFQKVPLRELREHMVDLLFPEKLDWKSLRKKLLNNEIDFRCQQLNEPAAGSSISFLEDELRAAIKAKPNPPGDIFIAWDTAMTDTSKADYSAGAVGTINPSTKGLHILEVCFGRWKQSELAYQVVMLCKRWSPRRIIMEKSGGSELLLQEIRRIAMQQRVTIQVIPFTPDTSDGAKNNRIKGMEILLTDGRLEFSPGNWIDETFAQFTRYTGERRNRGRKDDIPDAISMLGIFVPFAGEAPTVTVEQQQELADAAEEERKKQLAIAFHRHIFNSHVSAPQPEPNRPVRSRFDFRHIGNS
jgi:phage terminase large subunit-like protein